MARDVVQVRVSLTETEPFRILVGFLEDIEARARLMEDIDILEIVDECRADLLEACSEGYE